MVKTFHSIVRPPRRSFSNFLLMMVFQTVVTVRTSLTLSSLSVVVTAVITRTLIRLLQSIMLPLLSLKVNLIPSKSKWTPSWKKMLSLRIYPQKLEAGNKMPRSQFKETRLSRLWPELADSRTVMKRSLNRPLKESLILIQRIWTSYLLEHLV